MDGAICCMDRLALLLHLCLAEGRSGTCALPMFLSNGSVFEVTGLIREALGPLGWEAFFGFVMILSPLPVLCSMLPCTG